MKKQHILLFGHVVLVPIILHSCVLNDADDIIWNEERFDANVVVTSRRHLAFQDLIKYDGIWLAAYRESDRQSFLHFHKVNETDTENKKYGSIKQGVYYTQSRGIGEFQIRSFILNLKNYELE